MFARTFALSWLAYFGYYLCRKNLSVLMPYFKSEAGLSSTDLANTLFVYSLAYAIGQYSNGRLVDTIGARWVAGIGMLVSAAMSALMAWPPWVGVPLVLLALQDVNGAAQATGWPSVLKLTGDWFPRQNRGVVLGWWSTHMVLGGFAGTFLATRAAETEWTRGAWVPSIALASIAVVFLLFARDGSTETRTTESGKLILTPTLLSIAAMYFCIKLTRYAFLFWLPLYMAEHLHYSNTEAGYASSIFELVGFLGVPVAGYVSERRGMSRASVGAAMMIALSILCASYPMVSSMGYWPNLLMIALIGTCTFGPDTLMAAAALQDVVPHGSVGTAGGFVNGVGSVGQLVSPYVVALISARAGWGLMFASISLIVFCGAMALLLPMLREARPKVEVVS